MDITKLFGYYILSIPLLLLTLMLAGCTKTIDHTNIPLIPDTQKTCTLSKLKFDTTNDLIDGLYSLKSDWLKCKNKHDAVLGEYENLMGVNVK